MLIVNADDLGRNEKATDRILECFSARRINAASGMVFMNDSERAARLALERGLDVGLHLNFTESLTGDGVPPSLRNSHERIRKFLLRSKYALLFYNPFLRDDFQTVYRAQTDEYEKLYKQKPSRVDGHQHMHLCTNMLVANPIPAGTRVRRSFSFQAGEKSAFNLWYRRAVDRRLSANYLLTDYFFSVVQNTKPNRLRRIADLATASSVELMTHPELDSESAFLQSPVFSETAGTPLAEPSCVD